MRRVVSWLQLARQQHSPHALRSLDVLFLVLAREQPLTTRTTLARCTSSCFRRRTTTHHTHHAHSLYFSFCSPASKHSLHALRSLAVLLLVLAGKQPLTTRTSLICCTSLGARRLTTTHHTHYAHSLYFSFFSPASKHSPHRSAPSSSFFFCL